MKKIDLLALKLRDQISRREHITACANGDVAKYGEWQSDYRTWGQEIDKEVDTLVVDIDQEMEKVAP